MECKAGKEEHVMVLYICLFIEMVINQELTQTLHISKLGSTQYPHASEHQKLQMPVELSA